MKSRLRKSDPSFSSRRQIKQVRASVSVSNLLSQAKRRTPSDWSSSANCLIFDWTAWRLICLNDKYVFTGKTFDVGGARAAWDEVGLEL